MSSEIAIKLKSVYGRTLAYPANDCANIACEMVGKKTLTAHDLNCLKRMGFGLYVVDSWGCTPQPADLDGQEFAMLE